MKRSSGVLMHLTSLWGEYSIGAAGKEAMEWIDFLAEHGFHLWQVLPFCLPDECNSPYKSYSSFSYHPFLIDLDDLCARGLLTEEECAAAKQKTPYSCEFERLWNERLPLLQKAAQRFGDWDAVDQFMESHKHTAAFCDFMALKSVNDQKPWTQWTVTEPDQQTRRLWRFTQYIFYTQWQKIREYAKKKNVKIVGDIPIYVAWDSADVWKNPQYFSLDQRNLPTAVAGVPPDYFCADGQLWGNPLYDWDRMKKDHFLWWRERLAFMLELFDGVRIDHFRGFASYYAIPYGAETAKEGKWETGPGMDLIRSLKEVAKDSLLIAEDLGDITPDVKELVDESGFPGMRVFQFGFLGDVDSIHLPHQYSNHCVAYTGTHDNNTLLGYVWELDEKSRRYMLEYCGYTGEDWNRGYDSILRTMFESHAGILILPVQDLLLYGSDTRLNTPGRSHGNWSYRITKDQLCNMDGSKFQRWNRMYGRT